MSLTLSYRLNPARVETLQLDAAVTEEHGADNEVTAHPVEEGAAVVDHIRQQPDTITLEGIVTNTPLPTDKSPTLAQATRAQDAWDTLRRIRDGGILVEVATPLRVYTDMALVSLRVPRDARTGDALRFTATLRQVRTVTSQVRQVRQKTVRTPPVKGGPQGARPATPAERSKSMLVKFGEAISNYRWRPPQ